MANSVHANDYAANLYLDALAWHRNLRSLSPTSLFMTIGIDVMGENAIIETMLANKAILQPVLTPTPIPMLRNIQITLNLEPAILVRAIQESGSTNVEYLYSDAHLGRPTLLLTI
ncbi:hypothetical protein F4823DRAFT_565971 [Ustulina deusta]|nr:hypothetical protein F4823DRAFT_565971 [Ustulina deusta]